LNIKGIFKNAFPFISAAASVGGPLGTMAANAVGKALGVEKIDDIEQSIAGANPEQMLALKNAEQEFAAKMAELGFNTIEKLEEIAAADRASARQREIAIRDNTPKNLAYIIIGAFIGMAYMVLFKRMSADSALAGAVIGYLSAKAEQVTNYFFGSSLGSSVKTAILEKMGAK
jgi:hypothetical protein